MEFDTLCVVPLETLWLVDSLYDSPTECPCDVEYDSPVDRPIDVEFETPLVDPCDNESDMLADAELLCELETLSDVPYPFDTLWLEPYPSLMLWLKLCEVEELWLEPKPFETPRVVP